MTTDFVARHRPRAIAVGALAVTAVIIAFVSLTHRHSISTSGASCGSVVNGPTYDSQPAECLWRAYQGHRTARAIMVDTTVEGDPIQYTVDISTSRVGITIQSQDRYGPQGSFIYDCSGLTQRPAINGSGHVYLVGTGCQGPQGFLDDSGRVTIP